MKPVKMEIEKRVEEHLKELPHRAGLAVVIGRKEAKDMDFNATATFMMAQREGRESLCGLPIVRVDLDSYFAVEVPK